MASSGAPNDEVAPPPAGGNGTRERPIVEEDYVNVRAPSTRAELEVEIQKMHNEMMTAGRARNFKVAKEKKKQLADLKELRQTMLSVSELEAKIEELKQEVDRFTEEQDFDEAQSIYEELQELEKQLSEEKDYQDVPTGNQIGDDAKAEEPTELERPSLDTRERARNTTYTSTSPQSITEERVLFDYLTVFQSEPLVEMDSDDTLRPFALPPDFQTEKATLRHAVAEAKKIDAEIDVIFKKATTDRIAETLRDGNCRVIHFTGHGTKEYICIEDQFGKMKRLHTHELKEFLSSGGRHLKLVFVSACRSRDIGKAFLEAGVPHVVCVTPDEDLEEKTAIEFSRHFYRALALRRTVKEAFGFAQAGMKVAPGVHSQKFHLLPEKPEDDPYHEVQVFYNNAVHRKVTPETTPSEISGRFLPKPPIEFVGRNVLMYHLLKDLRRSRLVEIQGPARHGKSSFGQALCKYINNRKDAFFVEDIFWLPSLVHFDDDEHIYKIFRDLLNSSLEDGNPEQDIENSCTQHCGKIVRALQGKRSLLFIDAGEVKAQDAMAKLQVFVEVLLRGTEHVTIIFMSPPGYEDSGRVFVDKRVILTPLNMRESALLFGCFCRFVKGNVEEFVEKLVPEAQADAISVNKSMSRRCQEIYSFVGKGLPEDILGVAKEMTEAEFEKLMEIADREEFERKIESRAVLEHEISQTEANLSSAEENKDFKEAQKIKATLDELEHLRGDLPKLASLRVTEADLFTKLSTCVSSEDYPEARKVYKQLSEVRTNIEQEEKALLKLTQEKVEDHLEDRRAVGPSNHPKEGTLSTITRYQMRSTGEFDNGHAYSVVISHGSIVDFEYSNGSCGIVCSTNESCYPLPGGADGAVGKAGGSFLKGDIDKIPTVEKNDWGAIRCPTGKAVRVGPGAYGKLNVPYVIFAVGPFYGDIDGNSNQGKQLLRKRDEQLRSAYRKALKLAREAGLEAIALSLLSAGNRAGVHYERTLRVALEEVCGFRGYDELKEIRLCAFESFHCDSLTTIADELGLRSCSPNPILIPQPPTFGERMASWFQSSPPKAQQPVRPPNEETRYHCANGQQPSSVFSLVVVRGSIVEYGSLSEKCAIVCATNESCFPVQGAVDGVIGNAGGVKFKQAIKEELIKVGENEWGGIRCPTGEARIIGPQRYGILKAPYVIFAVGPTYSRDVGDGKNTDEEKDEQLRSAYKGSLELAEEAGLEAVAFSLLSAGKRAPASDLMRPLRVAAKTICAFKGYKNLREIRLYGYMQREADALNTYIQDVAGLPPQETISS